MKLLRVVASVLILLAIPWISAAGGKKPAAKDTISIVELKVQPAVSELAENHRKSGELKLISSSLEVQLISSLNATRVFDLVETSAAADTENDKIDVDAAEDADTAPPARVSAKGGAKYLFLPVIDGFEDKSETVDYPEIGRSSLNRRIFLSALVRIVEVSTGRMLPDAPAIQLSKAEEVKNLKIGRASSSDQLLVALAREMAHKLSQEVVSTLHPPKVLSVTGKKLMINRGSEAGFEKGDLLEIYAVRQVKDDDTGEEFIDETLVGQAIITKLDKKQSFANISGEDTGIVKGSVVRRMKSAAARRSEQEQQPPDPTIPDFGDGKNTGNYSGSGEKPLKWK